MKPIKFMKFLLTILILIFTLQIPSQADDIRDFQIEGISIGDSLLDHFSKEEIEKGMRPDYYPSKKFIKVEFWHATLNKYDTLSAHIKNKDKKYKVYQISGAILFNDSVNECYTKQKEVIKNLSSMFESAEPYDSGRQIHESVDKESTYDRYDFEFKSGSSISITCYNWSDASGYTDHLAVGANSKEFNFWLNNEAFN